MSTFTKNIVELDDRQKKLWGDTRAALIWHCPAFTHILYSMMSKGNEEHIAVFTPDVPIAATDGSYILLNPQTFFNYNLQERLFIVAHEICHGIFGHMEQMHRWRASGKVPYPDGKELAYDHQTMNMAMDYVINDMLIESNVGQYNKDWLHDKVKGTHMDDVATVYRRIFVENKNGGQSGGAAGPGQGQGQGQKSFDEHHAPGSSTGQDPNQASSNRNEVEWKTAIAGAIAAAKAHGNLPGAMERVLGRELEPAVDWTDKVQAFFARKPGGGSYDWTRPDRRFITRNIVAPSRTGYGAGPVVVGVDTSGSISAEILDRFFAEMSGILSDIRPTMLYVMWCDARVHRVDEIEDAMDLQELRMKRAPGGGGTSFSPVFDMVEEMEIEPEAVIYLTDGYAPFPREPDYPVLWGNISQGVSYPWGEVVDIPVPS